MKKYRKKPIIIEAIQWTGENIEEIFVFMNPQKPTYLPGFSDSDNIIGIETLEGLYKANINDWIIKGIKGEFYPCKPDIFNITYEIVE